MGYSGYSMSDNAVMAYGNGEKPLSKWTKKDILEAIEKAKLEEELTLNCSMEILKKAPIEVMRNICLYKSSWHHTSNHFNKTDFYSLDMDEISELTDEKLHTLIKNSKEEKATEVVEERWRCAFLEWSGTRKYPKATEYIEEGIVKGDWFIRADGSKKKTTANGFRFIEKIGSKQEADAMKSGMKEELQRTESGTLKNQSAKLKKAPRERGPKL